MASTTLLVPVPSSGDGPVIDVSRLVGEKTVVFSGTFRGVCELLGSQDDATFVPLLGLEADAEVPIRLTIPGAIKSMRVRSAATFAGPASCLVTGIDGPGLNHFATITFEPSGWSGTSSPIDTAALFPPSGLEEDICLLCRGGFEGLVVVEGSPDGVTYRPVGSFRADRRPEGAPAVVEFAAISTADKIRYLRVSTTSVLDASTTITVGGRTQVIVVTSSPDGVLVAPAGTRAYLDDGTAAWDDVDGGTTWRQVGSSSPAIVAEVATVAKSGAQYASVAAAVAAVAPLATAATPWVVSVASGLYVEPPFTIPPYVTVQGLGFVVLQAANLAVDFITGTPGSLLNYVTVLGPTGFGAAAIRHNTASPNRFLISNVILARGYYGLHVSAGTVFGNTVLNLVGGAGFTEFARVDGGAQCLLTNSDYEGLAGSTTRGFVCTGPGSTLNLTNVIFGCPGATGAFVDDDGLLVLDLAQFVSGSTAIHVGNSGAPQLFARATAIREGGGGGFTTNLRVDTSAARVHFYGAMSRGKFVLAPGVALEASFQDVTPGDGGSTTIGDVYTARSGNPNLAFPISTYHLDTNWTGLRGSGNGGVSKLGGLNVAIAADYGYINDGTDERKVVWGATVLTLSPNATEYIWIDASGIAHHTVAQPVYADSIVLAQAVTNGTDVVLLTRDEITIAHTLSRTQEYFEDVIGPISIGGGATSVSSGNPLGLDVDPGEFAVGISERDIVGAAGITFTYWYQSSPGAWVAVPGQASVDTARYNDITAGLVAMTGTNWKKDLLYVVSNAGGDEYHVVYGQEQLASQVAAEQGNYPAPPFVLEHYAMRSGGVVSQRNALAIASVTDARPRIGGFITTAGVTIHGALTGLGADDHLQYLTTGRANTWHFSTPVAGEAHVKNGNLHQHSGAGDGGQVSHLDLSNIGTNAHVAIDSHLASTANPHATTYSQVGACSNTDPRLSDARTPTGAAGGSLAGTYPGPSIAAGAVGSAEIAAGAVGTSEIASGAVTDNEVTAANKDGTAATPSMRTLGTGAQQACSGSDSRLSDARTPTGAASGSLAGTYPSPTIAAGAVTATEVAAANKDGTAGTPSMRTLGTGAQQACSGSDSRLSDARAPTGSAGGSLAGTYPSPSIAPGAVATNEVAPANKDGLAAVPSMRTLGVTAQQACAGNDSRLSDARTPTGAAGGSLAGTYPSPSIAAGAVGTSNLAAGAVTANEVAAANKDGTAGTPSMRTLGTGAQQACSGSDSRLSDARTPTGAASGFLAGTYPSPTIAAGAVTATEVAAANKDGTAGTPSMRTLGTGAQQACAGNDARLSDARLPLGYQEAQSTSSTPITGANSNVYPPTGPGTKLTLTTAALTGTYRLSWHCSFTYSANNRDAFIRVRNTTDGVTIAEKVQRYANAATAVDEFTGFASIAFAGAAKTFAIEFHNSNTGDTITTSNAYMDLWKTP